MRLLAAAAAAGVVVGGTGCAAGDDGATGETAAPTTGEHLTTTSSTPVPGTAEAEFDIPVQVADRWAALGGVEGDLGAPTGPPTDVAGGSITEFERGSLVMTPQGRVFVVQGEILAAYLDEGGPAGDLGFPTADEATTDGGWISTFEGGVITVLDGAVEVRVDSPG